MNVLNIHGKRDYLRVDDEGNLLISGVASGGSGNITPTTPVPQIVTIIKEVPVEKRVEVVKEVIKTVEVEKQVEVVREVIKEIPVYQKGEVIKEVIKEVPVEHRVEVVRDLSIEEMEALVVDHRNRLGFLDPLIAQLGSRPPSAVSAGLRSAQVATLVKYAEANGLDVWYSDYDGQYPVKWIDNGQASQNFIRATTHPGNGREYVSFKPGRPLTTSKLVVVYTNGAATYATHQKYLDAFGANRTIPYWFLGDPQMGFQWDHTASDLTGAATSNITSSDWGWDPTRNPTQTSESWSGPISFRPVFGNADGMIFCKHTPAL